MNVGFNTRNIIDSNYFVKLNDKEILIYEEDTSLKKELSPEAKQRKEIEKEQKLQEEKKQSNPQELDESEKELVKKLQSRDAEVKMHESAHQAAGAGATGAASFSYQQGPDGKMYAIGGEVSISISSGATPEETIANARKIAAAAMAPASPSGQDFAVASSAKVMEMKALQQLQKEKQNEIEGQNNYKENAITLA